MALSVSEIEELVRRHTKSTEVILGVDPGLSALNAEYMRVAAMFKWEEFRRVVTSFALQTQAGVLQYPWFSSSSAVMDGGTASSTAYTFTADGGTASSTVYAHSANDGGIERLNAPVFYDVTAVEVGTTASSSVYDFVVVPVSESGWIEVAKDANSIPVYYMRLSDGTENVVELRPAPSYSGGVIKVTGYVEPDLLTSSNSVTEFLSRTPDYAIARYLAANLLLEKGDIKSYKSNRESATRALDAYFSTDIVPKEMNWALEKRRGLSKRKSESDSKVLDVYNEITPKDVNG